MAEEVGDLPQELDDEFYERADAFIHLANDQQLKIHRSYVSASMMHGTARFNIYVSAVKAVSAEQLAASREMIVDYFIASYRKSLNLHLDDYVANFEDYVRTDDEDGG
jgi:hypothetical protein